MTNWPETLFSGAVVTQVRISPQASLGSALGVNNSNPEWQSRELYYEVVWRSRQQVDIKVTDRQDPLFIWQSTVGEDDYFVLRREQQLLVDYQRFPHRLVDFLRQCQAGNAGLVIYLSIVGDGQASLQIAESTAFKQLNHFSLTLSPIPESQMKRMLAETVKRYREEIDVLRHVGGLAYTPTAAHNTTAPTAMPSAPTAPMYTPSMPLPVPNYQQPSSYAQQHHPEVARLLGIIDTMQEARRQAEEAANQARMQATGLEGELRSKQADIEKANEIIRRQQEEHRALKTRCKSAESALKQQERLNLEIQQAHEANLRELATLRERLAEISNSHQGCQAREQELQEQVRNVQSDLNHNRKVTAWLSEQIQQYAPDLYQRITSGSGRLSAEEMAGKSPAF